jgi:hypothetical protein
MTNLLPQSPHFAFVVLATTLVAVTGVEERQ